MGLFGTNCQNCGTYFSWVTPDQQFNLNSVGAGGGFCSAHCRADYARNRQMSDAYKEQQERERQIEKKERESEKEQFKRRELLDKCRTMWFGDLAHQHGMHSIDEWDWCCRECRGAVLNHAMPRSCSRCGCARLQLKCMVTSVEKHDGATSKATGEATYGASFANKFVWFCSECNQHDDTTFCDNCGEELTSEDIRAYSGAGHHWMNMLYCCRGLAWGPLALNLETSTGLFWGYSPIKTVSEFRKRFGIPAAYPILATVNFDGSFFDQKTQIGASHAAKIVVAGSRLYMREGERIANSVSLIDLAQQGAKSPKRGWFSSTLQIADSQLQLAHGEAELLAQAIDDIVNGVRNACPAYNLVNVTPPSVSKYATPPSLPSFPRPTPPPSFSPNEPVFEEAPAISPTPSLQSAPNAHSSAAEIPEQLLSRIRDRVKREYRGDSESQSSELESQIESYRALQEIVAQPPDSLDGQTLAKIVRRAQREHPLDLQMQLHEAKEQIEGHAEVELLSDSNNHSDVPNDVLNKIVRKAKREHSNDFSMQSYEMREQISAYVKLTEMRNSPSPGMNGKKMAKAIADAEREYPDDYSMQVYHIEQGFEDDTD